MPIDQNYAELFSCLVQAGEIAEEIQSNKDFEVEEKTSKTDIVTKADKELSTFLIEKIQAIFPRDEIISEEEDQSETEKKLHSTSYWLVDPVDGTWNFRNRIPLWSPMIARIVNGQVEAAALYYPGRRTLYVAQRGRGLWEVGETWKQLHNPQHSNELTHSVGHIPMECDNKNSRLALHKAVLKASEELEMNLRVLAHANAGIAGLLSAEGALSWNLMVDAALWDFAPMVLFAREVGIQALTFDGEDWYPLAAKSHTLVLGSKEICDQLMVTVIDEYKKLL